MYVVDGKIVSSKLFSTQFMCNLDKCKGACCWEGDFGAPVTDEEVEIMKEISDIILPRLTAASREINRFMKMDHVSIWLRMIKA